MLYFNEMAQIHSRQLDVKLNDLNFLYIVEDDNQCNESSFNSWKWEPKYIFGNDKRGPRGFT